jgi:hypothetical protein
MSAGAKKKGTRRESEAKAILEELGYAVTKSGGSLGEFDLVAVPAMTEKWTPLPEPRTRLIQVKSNICPPGERNALFLWAAFYEALYPDRYAVEIWIKRDYAREWDIENLNDGLRTGHPCVTTISKKHVGLGHSHGQTAPNDKQTQAKP